MILHIPHSSRHVPIHLRDQIILSDEELSAELTLMTDAFTDELFALPEATTLRFPLSRLLVDVERFPNDEDEPMSKVGMGKIYSHTSDGKKLRRRLSLQEIARLTSYYKRHHQLLAAAVKRELAMHGQTLIVDCHSFPNKPLPCDMDQSSPRQDFCIGTDSFHTPIALAQTVKLALTREGCNVQFNHPYAGTMIPLEFYGKDCRVLSIMIEINRSLYMNEATGERSNGFDALRQAIHKHLRSLAEFPHRR